MRLTSHEPTQGVSIWKLMETYGNPKNSTKKCGNKNGRPIDSTAFQGFHKETQ